LSTWAGSYRYVTNNPTEAKDPLGLLGISNAASGGASGGAGGCCKKCPGGHWRGIGWDVGISVIYGITIAQGTIKCVTDPSMEYPFVTFCHNVGRRNFGKGKWGIGLVASLTGIEVNCFNAQCPDDLEGDSFGGGGGKAFGVLGGSVSVTTGVRNHAMCVTAGIGIGVGAGANFAGCRTYL
jgi:hypothetical protein